MGIEHLSGTTFLREKKITETNEDLFKVKVLLQWSDLLFFKTTCKFASMQVLDLKNMLIYSSARFGPGIHFNCSNNR